MAKWKKITEYAVQELDSYGDILDQNHYATLAEATKAFESTDWSEDTTRVDLEKQVGEWEIQNEHNQFLRDTFYDLLKTKEVTKC